MNLPTDDQLETLKNRLIETMTQIRLINKQLEKHLTTLLQVANETRKVHGLESIDNLTKIQSRLTIDSFKIYNELQNLAQSNQNNIYAAKQRYKQNQKDRLKEILNHNLIDTEWVYSNLEITSLEDDFLSSYQVWHLYHADHPEVTIERKKFTRMIKTLLLDRGWIIPQSVRGHDLILKRINNVAYRGFYGVKWKKG